MREGVKWNKREEIASYICASLLKSRSSGAARVINLLHHPQIIFYFLLQPLAVVAMDEIDSFSLPHRAVALFT